MQGQSPARVWVEVHLGKIRSNFEKIADRVKPSAVMAVLKANAYGLGINPIAQALKTVNVQRFGVAESREALAVADLGVPTQILGGLLEDDIPDVLRANIIAPITNVEAAKLLNEHALKQNKIVECHILVDTGMGRLGIPLSKAEGSIRKISKMPGLTCTGIYSHFPHAYGDPEFSRWQVAQITALLRRLQNKQISFRWVHIANSDGINNIPESYRRPYNLVRVGLNLYGIFDLNGQQSLDLEPVLVLKTRLIEIRSLPVGTTISYGRTYKVTRPTLVGTIAIGYADGLPIAMSNNGYVLLGGHRCSILGRISMDYTTISIDKVPNAKVGDEVICLDENISVNDWAQRKNSIPYDILCSLGSRVERRYISDE